MTVIERNRPGDTFGWGVVFSDETLRNLQGGDAESLAEIEANFAHWDDIDVHFRGRVIRSGGHGFCGIARKRLLGILQARAAALGVELRFETELRDLAAIRPADLIVAADGVNSTVRAARAAVFRPAIDVRRNRFVWLGTHQTIRCVHLHLCPDRARLVLGARLPLRCRDLDLHRRGQRGDLAGGGPRSRRRRKPRSRFCERLFAPWLGGHRLLANMAHLRGSQWIRFNRVSNERWVDGNIVLMGDAAHTAHFSIGSGTKLALEDAIALAQAFERHGADVPAALAAYEAERRIEVLKIQSAARNSTEWFEHVDRYVGLEPEQFAYSLLTRSQRVSHENLRLRDRTYLEGMESWLAARANGAGQNLPVPPMFLPFRLRGMTLANRVVVSPMATYSAADGMPNDFHLVHLGARALGGAGLVFTEMTCVTPEGRITPGCAGMYTDAQCQAWRRIVDFVHAQTGAKICLQLGHSGPKGSTKLGWEGMDEPLDGGNWEVIGPSPVPWSAQQPDAPRR